LEGRSLVPIFKGKERDGHERLFFEYGSNSAIRKGKWKLVRYRGFKWELYDMEEDRTELNDLADQYPDKVKQLARLWHDIRGRRMGRQNTRLPDHRYFPSGRRGRR
jgi:arylsulfatase